MRLLVVGGAGYIGSVVALHLSERGHDLTVCDNLATGNAWAIPGTTRFVPADLRDSGGLARIVSAGYDAVLHFAGLGPSTAPAGDPLGHLGVNLGGTVALLGAMQAHGVRRLVYWSSAAVYGLPARLPVEESSPAVPAGPYGTWQRTVEEAVGFCAAAGNLGAVGLRLFNVAGACGSLGEWHRPETHLIPLVLQVAAGVRPAVCVNGVDYDTVDGTAVRDYVHVEDVARATLLALEATAKPGHAVYNVGSGAGHSVRQVIDIARKVTNCPIPAVDAPRRPGDVSALVGSVTRARDELGWVPARDVTGAIADAWSWMRQRLSVGPAAALGPGALTIG